MSRELTAMIEDRLQGEELLGSLEPAKPAGASSEDSGPGSPGLEAESGVGPEALKAPPAGILQVSPGELKLALEAVLFSVAEPLAVRSLAEIFGASLHDIREAAEELAYEYATGGRAFRLEDIAGGLQILTLPAYDPWIRRLREKQRDSRLSGAALETLAVIAYKQPIIKADLEAIRGVQCSPILKTLLDRGLIKVVGRDESLGRPLLYGTTSRFLESFGLPSLRDLPQPEAPALAPSGAPRAEAARPASAAPAGEGQGTAGPETGELGPGNN
jgi:segregation and condensation protein B